MTTPSPPDSIRILLVDDHPMVREGLRAVLAAQATFSVVGEAGSAAEALELARESTPDVVLVDIELKGESGLALIPRLRAQQPSVRVLVVTMHNKPFYVQSADEAGADGYVLKDDPSSVLVSAIQRAVAGRRTDSQDVHRKKLAWLLLTSRERQVARLLAKGFSNDQVAYDLGIRVSTVHSHRSQIYDKLGVRSALEIAEYIRKNGIPADDE